MLRASWNTCLGCTIAFGIRNLGSAEKGLAEMQRILAPGGRLVILEFYESQDGSFFITVRENKIDSIFCYKELFYKNTNLIKLTIDQFKIITESNFIGKIDELDFEDDGIPQFVYEFETIGLQVWEKSGLSKLIPNTPAISKISKTI